MPQSIIDKKNASGFTFGFVLHICCCEIEKSAFVAVLLARARDIENLDVDDVWGFGGSGIESRWLENRKNTETRYKR